MPSKSLLMVVWHISFIHLDGREFWDRLCFGLWTRNSHLPDGE